MYFLVCFANRAVIVLTENSNQEHPDYIGGASWNIFVEVEKHPKSRERDHESHKVQ